MEAERRSPVRIHLVTGFLGSGKTTLLRNLLEQGLHGERVAVLVNEFGEVGIDGGLLRRSGQPVIELDSGCICCEVGADMLSTLQEMVRDYHPDRIVFELSGLAEPGSVLAALHSRAVLPGLLRVEPTICVVDAPAWRRLSSELSYGYWNQIQAADIVLLNKTDGLPEGLLGAVAAEVRECNPAAAQISCSWCQVDLAALFDAQPAVDGIMPPRAHASRGAHLAGFTSHVLRDPGTVFERSRIERFLETLPAELFRVKGTVRCREGALFVSWVRSGATWEPAAPTDPDPTTLVCIGRSLVPSALEAALARCASRRRGISLSALPTRQDPHPSTAAEPRG